MKKKLQTLIDEGPTESWLMKHSEIEFTKELGMGTSGRVFKGFFRQNKVAVKVFRAVDSEDLEEFKKEFLIMSIINSPNIIHFFGACLEPKICMVMEYCRRGSLTKVLKDTSINIDWEQGLKFAIDMATGMETLHNWSPPIFHRDMKSANLLLNSDWDLKICDMGLARFNTPDTENSMKRLCGTYSYLAPEIVNGEIFSPKADVFSMGIVLWEIAYRVVNGKYQAPYAEFGHLTIDVQVAIQVTEKQLRNTIPLGCLPAYATLIALCTAHSPHERPTTSQLRDRLIDIENRMNSEQ